MKYGLKFLDFGAIMFSTNKIHFQISEFLQVKAENYYSESFSSKYLCFSKDYPWPRMVPNSFFWPFGVFFGHYCYKAAAEFPIRAVFLSLGNFTMCGLLHLLKFPMVEKHQFRPKRQKHSPSEPPWSPPRIHEAKHFTSFYNSFYL